MLSGGPSRKVVGSQESLTKAQERRGVNRSTFSCKGK